MAGASFDRTTSRGFTKEQFYSTASYQTKQLQNMRLWQNDLDGWNLAGQDLTNASLYQATLTNAILSGANLTDANLQQTTLTGADLRGALLSQATLSQSTLTGADLTGAGSHGCRSLPINAHGCQPERVISREGRPARSDTHRG